MFDYVQYEYDCTYFCWFYTGFMNTMAGGGSLLTLPLLIFMGLPAAVANGTNRVAILMSTSSATLGFKSKNVSTFPFNIYLGISGLLGAFIGAKIAIEIDGGLFNKILAVIMIVVVGLIVLKPNIKQNDLIERSSCTCSNFYYCIFFYWYLWWVYKCRNRIRNNVISSLLQQVRPC